MKKFESDLQELRGRLARMAALTQSMVASAMSAVRDRRQNVRAQIDELESQLDHMQTEIDKDAIRLLTVYSPVASQLRYVLVVTHITAQLERIGDQVVNVCEGLELMQSEVDQHVLPDLHKMSELVAQIVEDAFASFFDNDADKADATRSRDDIIDALNAQIINRLLSDEVLHGVLKGTRDIADALAQILIARHLERIADQAVNICKEVIYLVRGDDVRHSANKHGANKHSAT
ncbi:MAG: phosphate signaling complex protein PhoU [Pirellulaceae bacterium]|jgi:phosphate transport system protein|nr:phosphate signaling complex protein PhoU [Pirellulaceae bacterium]